MLLILGIGEAVVSEIDIPVDDGVMVLVSASVVKNVCVSVVNGVVVSLLYELSVVLASAAKCVRQTRIVKVMRRTRGSISIEKVFFFTVVTNRSVSIEGVALYIR